MFKGFYERNLKNYKVIISIIEKKVKYHFQFKKNKIKNQISYFKQF